MIATGPWLPQSCLVSRRAVEPFERQISDWASEWFRSIPWQVLGTWDVAVTRSIGQWTTICDTEHFQVKGKAKVLHSLALAILNAKQQAKYTDTDLSLMRRLGKRAIDDLLDRIEQEFSAVETIADAGAHGTCPRYSLLIGMVGNAQLAIECSQPDLVRVARSTFRRSQDLPPPVLRQQCYSGQTVNVAAHIGSARITVEQLGGLEVGDTLVLDRPSHAAVDLLLEDRIASLPVLLAEADGHITLEIQENP